LGDRRAARPGRSLAQGPPRPVRQRRRRADRRLVSGRADPSAAVTARGTDQALLARAFLCPAIGRRELASAGAATFAPLVARARRALPSRRYPEGKIGRAHV